MTASNLELFPPPDAWECRARPVALVGRPCGHVNAHGVRFDGLMCCESCGATRAASDDRARRECEARR